MSRYHRISPKDKLRHHYSLEASHNEDIILKELMQEKGLRNKGELLRASIEAYAGKPIFRNREVRTKK